MGNSLGSFMDADLSFIQIGVMCMSKVLVNLDLHKFLTQDIVIEWGDRDFSTTVGLYRGLVSLNRSHYYGHIIAKCCFKKQISS